MTLGTTRRLLWGLMLPSLVGPARRRDVHDQRRLRERRMPERHVRRQRYCLPNNP
jgi:hypothetical protein